MIINKINIQFYLSYLFISYLLVSGNNTDAQGLKASASPAAIDSSGFQVYSVSPETDYLYAKPKAFRFITNFPSDMKDYYKQTFTQKNSWKIGAMIGGTALLVWLDQPIIDGVQKFGNNIGIKGTEHQKTIFNPKIKFGNKNHGLAMNIPQDLNTAMYFIGDGWTHISFAIGFYGFGKISNDYRALQTASQIMECILLTGTSTQFLKHITGRQSPYAVGDPVKNPGGVWHVFPNQFEYAMHVPNYDAFPSGHLATAMATATVIAENYPEYKFIKPVAYTMLGLLSFSMLNNGVHWMSDYPLSVAMGYTFAKIVTAKGRKPVNHEAVPSHHAFLRKTKKTFSGMKLSPVYNGNSWLVSLSKNF